MADIPYQVPSQVDLAMVSGDSKTIRVKCLAPGRIPFVLADVSTADWRLSKTVKGPAILSKDMTSADVVIVQDGDNWFIDVVLAPADTDALVGDYYHECQLVMGDARVITPYAGLITIVQDLIV